MRHCSQANQQDSRVATGRKTALIREIEVLCHQKPRLRLGSTPDIDVGPTTEAFIKDRVNVMAQRAKADGRRSRDVLVELQPHATFTSGGNGDGAGRSSTADAAANAMTARMASSETEGNSRRIASVVSPCARWARSIRTSTRVPLTTGCPPQMAVSRMMAQAWSSGTSPAVVDRRAPAPHRATQVFAEAGKGRAPTAARPRTHPAAGPRATPSVAAPSRPRRRGPSSGPSRRRTRGSWRPC